MTFPPNTNASGPKVYRDREVFTRERLKIKPPKVKAWSHHDDLKTAIGKRVKIQVSDSETDVIEGLLLETDAYTLLVHFDHPAGQSKLTVFKHAIIMFTVLG